MGLHRTHDANGLEAVHAFAATLVHASWFAACGEPLTEAERAEAAAYLAALGQSDAEIAGVPGWAEARAAIKRPDWSHAWWDAEALAQAELRKIAETRYGETTLMTALTFVTEAADALHGAAAVATSRAGVADPPLTRVAAGAAAQACYHQALVLAADAGPDHLFAIKYRLFAAGRWPLGIVGDRFFVF